MYIRKYLNLYQGEINPRARYASFDYCYNYFQNFRDNNSISQISHPNNMQMSCLQIAFYLASWGMLRGSTTLLQKSVKYYEELITIVATCDANIWEIDVTQYNNNETIELLVECDIMITQAIVKRAAPNESWPTTTLITKIMLGIFGNIPAFDTYFIKFLGTRRINKRSILKIYDYYMTNHAVIDQEVIYTIDFATSQPTNRRYPKAKIIDMIGFIGGQLSG